MQSGIIILHPILAHHGTIMVNGLLVDLKILAQIKLFFYASDDFYGLTDDKNKWNFWNGSSYISPTDPSDIQITCVNNG